MNIDRLSILSRNASLLASRTAISAVFAFHGAQQLFGLFGGGGVAGTTAYFDSLGVPFPALHAVLVPAVHLLGALALATGFGMRITAVPLAITMLVAAIVGHDGFDIQQNGNEYALVLAATVPALAAVGPGDWTLTRALEAIRTWVGVPAPRRRIA